MGILFTGSVFFTKLSSFRNKCAMMATMVSFVQEADVPKAPLVGFLLSANRALIHPKYSGSLWGRKKK